MKFHNWWIVIGKAADSQLNINEIAIVWLALKCNKVQEWIVFLGFHISLHLLMTQHFTLAFLLFVFFRWPGISNFFIRCININKKDAVKEWRVLWSFTYSSSLFISEWEWVGRWSQIVEIMLTIVSVRLWNFKDGGS